MNAPSMTTAIPAAQAAMPGTLPTNDEPLAYTKPKKHQPTRERVVTLQPLATEKRAAIPTEEAALHLGRAEQTLRIWACRENGLLRPIRVGTRLMWPTDALRRVLGLTESANATAEA